jgi:hypothetical protein
VRARGSGVIGRAGQAVGLACLPATFPTSPSSRKIAAKLHEDVAFRVKWIAEPPNGWIKNVLGFRQFSLRGLHRVQAEWKLLNTVLNLRRMCSLRTA